MAWKVFARIHLKNIEECPVVFENISIKKATLLPYNERLSFFVTILPRSGNFEIIESGNSVAIGKVRLLDNNYTEYQDLKQNFTYNRSSITLNTEDFYRICNLRKYKFENDFQGLIETELNGKVNSIVFWMVCCKCKS